MDYQSSKARSIARLLNQLNISKSGEVAFGDGLNDMEMFKLVGAAIAMGNAHPMLKQHAHIICPRHDQDGIEKNFKSAKLDLINPQTNPPLCFCKEGFKIRC